MNRRNKTNNKRGFSKSGRAGKSKNPRNSRNNRGFRGRRGQRSGNRRFNTSKISHDRYISSAVESEPESVYVEDAQFNDFNLNKTVKQNISNKGYVNPTKIQNEAIPQIINGKDILGLASTGSGKTAAFLLPMISKSIQNPNEKCLIIVPTRELANQIQSEFKTFTKHTSVIDALIIGGASFNAQIKRLNMNPQFVIATPGRLLDLSNKNNIDLKGFNNVVLDEVDQMLDMGFIKDIEMIISRLANNKQSLFFSATMNEKAENLARTLLNNPVKIQVAKQKAALNVDQNIIKYNTNEDKIKILNDLLGSIDFNKVLVFSKTRHGADSLFKKLKMKGHRSAVIHGNKSMGHRNKVIRQFKTDSVKVLVATDVAARGIDIPDISHIINYDEPATYDDYIHRIGRTGRIGKKGVALTFVR